MCKDNNGNTVADAFCSHPKPPITQTGTPATCNTTPVNGVCSTTENSCSVGSVANYNPTTHTWSCIGSNGGTTASCSTSIQGTCGSANG